MMPREAKLPDLSHLLSVSPPGMHASAWFLESQQATGVQLPESSSRRDTRLPDVPFSLRSNPQRLPSAWSLVSLWPEMAAVSSTLVAPRGKKIQTMLLVEGAGRMASCAPTPPAATETATIPAATQTATETPAPTETPTLTPSPTPTENPLAGVPEGTTGKDPVTGEWTKENTEHPDRPFHYKSVPNSEIEGWYWNAASEPLIDEEGFGTTMPFNLWCEEGVQCPALIHPPTVILNPTDQSSTRTIISQLIARDTGKLFQHTSKEEWEVFFDKLANNQLVIPFRTVDGTQYEYRIRPQSSFNIYVKKEELANPDYVQRRYVQGTIRGDDQGNINVVEYSYLPISKDMKPIDFADRLLVYPFMVFYIDDLSQANILNRINNPGLIDLAEWTVKGKNPYFVFTP